MDCDLNFNSDSTYCSLYENTGQTMKGNYKARHKIKESEVLDIIHEKILLHWEGKQLIGRIEAQKFMKQISKMKIKNYKDQYFAEKIQSSLYKIFNLAKEFEKCFSSTHNSQMFDPIKDCSFTQDLNFLKNETVDPKQILLGTTSVNTERSFPIELLTNNNFISSNSGLNNNIVNPQNCVDNIENEGYKGEVNLDSNIVGSQDMFPSENSELFEQHLSKSNNGTDTVSVLCRSDVLNSDEMQNRKCLSDISNEILVYEIGLPQSFRKTILDKNKYGCDVNRNTICPSQGVALAENVTSSTNVESKHKTCNENGIIREEEVCNNQIILHESNFSEDGNVNIKQATGNNVVNKEYIDVMAMISNMTDGEEASFINTDDFPNTEVSETLLFDGNSVKTINVKHITALGNESETGKSWQEIQRELEHGENLARTLNHTLDGLFEKLCLEERECVQREFGEKSNRVGNLHNFSLEDKAKLDMEGLFRRNTEKLEKISEEFRKKLDIEKMKVMDNGDDDDYEALDWRKLLK